MKELAKICKVYGLTDKQIAFKTMAGQRTTIKLSYPLWDSLKDFCTGRGKPVHIFLQELHEKTKNSDQTFNVIVRYLAIYHLENPSDEIII